MVDIQTDGTEKRTKHREGQRFRKIYARTCTRQRGQGKGQTRKQTYGQQSAGGTERQIARPRDWKTDRHKGRDDKQMARRW